MNYFSIRKFSGIETLIEQTSQDRGTLRKAEGVLVSPRGAISNGPEWAGAWGISDLGAEMEAVKGAGTGVEFATITRAGHVLLVAWDFAAGRARGIWHVEGEGDPAFASEDGASIASTGKSGTAGKRWYGSWIDGCLWLGNGVSENLIWKDGALEMLGEDEPGDPMYDKGQVKFPPCTSFVNGPDRVVYGAGNEANPLRIWMTARPTDQFRSYERIENLETAYSDVRFTGATRITALSRYAETIVAHTDRGAVYDFRLGYSSDGFKTEQKPTAVNAGAINPDCCRDSKLGAFYFALDGEVYKDHAPRAGQYNKRADRNRDLAGNLSEGDWNKDMLQPVDGSEYFTVYNHKAQQFWFWGKLAVGGWQGSWCYDQRFQCMTGPFRYPDLVCAAPARDDNLPGFQVVGVTGGGAMVFADLGKIGERRFSGEFDAPLDSAYSISSAEPEATPGLPLVGLAGETGIIQKLEGLPAISMAGPWDDFEETELTATRWIKDASVAVVDFAYQDFGQPYTLKDFDSIQLGFHRNSVAYAGIYAETEGKRGGRFKGLVYPREIHKVRLNLKGEALRIRLVLVFLNGAPAMLREVTVYWLPGIAR